MIVLLSKDLSLSLGSSLPVVRRERAGWRLTPSQQTRASVVWSQVYLTSTNLRTHDASISKPAALLLSHVKGTMTFRLSPKTPKTLDERWSLCADEMRMWSLRIRQFGWVNISHSVNIYPDMVWIWKQTTVISLSGLKLAFKLVACLFSSLFFSLFQVCFSNSWQRGMRVTYGRFHILSSMSSNQSFLGFLPSHALGGGANISSPGDWNLCTP